MTEQDGAQPAHSRVVVAIEATAASIEFFPAFRRLLLPQLQARLPPLGTFEVRKRALSTLRPHEAHRFCVCHTSHCGAERMTSVQHSWPHCASGRQCPCITNARGARHVD